MIQVESIYTVAKSYLSGYIQEKSLTKNNFENKKFGITLMSNILGASDLIFGSLPGASLVSFFLKCAKSYVFFDETKQFAQETI